MILVALLVISIYAISLLFLFLYSIGQLHLTWSYVRNFGARPQTAPLHTYPFVTIQLPIYNELYVVERLLEAVAQMDYPSDRFEIQVLDDSTDETSDIIAQTIQRLNSSVQIHHIRREKRTGFKAGALKYGTQLAKGEFLAIFDADFLPKPGFLRETLPHFMDNEVGVVQTRWDHLNRKYSLLTHYQAFGLDAHFTVEQAGRNAEECFISFNGTAGIWRKKCIDEAGGWESDTLTEDLDLSYRAQLKGWKFKYLEEVTSPAELPVTMSAFKSQQYRWNKGAAETHRKVWNKVWHAKMPLKVKFHAVLQLFKGLGFVASFALTMISIPVLWVKWHTDTFDLVLQGLTFTFLCIVILSFFYYVSLLRFIDNPFRRIGYFLLNFPVFLALSLGISLHNTIAVIEGYIGRKTPFVRTPKFNVMRKADGYTNNRYRQNNLSWLTLIEGLLTLYFVSGLFLAVAYGDYSFFPFHLLLILGYGFIFAYSLIQQLRTR